MNEFGYLEARKYTPLETPVVANGEMNVTAKSLGNNVVEYAISNPADVLQYCVLYRGVQDIAPPYFFGNAFYAAYMEMNIADFIALTPPTTFNPNDRYPLVALDVGLPELLVCFCFPVPPKSTISILEGGIPNANLLVDMHAYIVKLLDIASLNVFYNAAAVAQYNLQSGSNVGYMPDPTFIAGRIATGLALPTNEIFPLQYALKKSTKPHNFEYYLHKLILAIMTDKGIVKALSDFGELI